VLRKGVVGMSERNTFVTSYLHVRDDSPIKAGIRAILEQHAFVVHDCGQYFAGMIKGEPFEVGIDLIVDECRDILRAHGHEIYFDIAMIGDSHHRVFHYDKPYGECCV
jgi:hypothetical protein